MNYRTILITTAIVTAGLLGSSAHAANAAGDWQLKQLHTPSKGLVTAENRGRVTIYDGLHEDEVDRAMDQQFERIDNMMFIRTLEETPSGELVAQDDDC